MSGMDILINYAWYADIETSQKIIIVVDADIE
jgi:hypothetical protein